MEIDLPLDITPPTPLRVALGDGLSQRAGDASRLLLTLDAHKAQGQALQRCLDDLHWLSSGAEPVQRFTGGVAIAFAGLDRDPRQTHTIPECRDLLKALHGQWPYWMHFLAPEPDLWQVLMLSLLPMDAGVRLPDGRIGHELDRRAFKNLLLEMALALNELHEQHQVPLATRQRIFRAATQAIERATGLRA